MAFLPASRLKGWVLGAVLATLAGAVSAQGFSIEWSPRSGDDWVDAQLADINRYGSRYREPFVDEMVRYYGAPRALVTDLLVTRRWAPGDVYYACAIAQALGRPCRYVAEAWGRSHAQGWAEVAKELGIKPGSPEFHRLKRGIVPTYDRWARPIEIDRDLRRDFPNRGRGNSADANASATPPPASSRAERRGAQPSGRAKGAGKGGSG